MAKAIAFTRAAKLDEKKRLLLCINAGQRLEITQRVLKIMEEVRQNGDEAVRKYIKKFDGIELDCLEVEKREIKRAYGKLDAKQMKAIKESLKNVKRFAEKQVPREWIEEKNGITLGELARPINTVGVYVPGGNYPLPSSAIMCIVPAKVAGVKKIVVCTPNVSAATLVAADMAGADRIFRVGGAQAITAMAYGTETIPRVDKIVGPGNVYVTTAKKLVYGDVGIDFIAGPSEVVIIAGAKADAKIIAADMLAQAEHDADARAILITTSKNLGRTVKKELEKQLESLSTKKIAGKAVKKVIIVKSLGEAFKLANEIAPEHLGLMFTGKKFLNKVKNAGSVFVGKYSAEAAGDYAVGPNHVLPTGGLARARSGLSVADFVRKPAVQIVSKKALERLSRTVKTLADMEGLEAHKKSIEVRLDE